VLDYCKDDASHHLGSGASDFDYARDNIVAQNQIYKLQPQFMIREGRDTDSPNYIDYNTTVGTSIRRLAGCYVRNGYSKSFILHGESIQVFRRVPTGEPYTSQPHTCFDGDLRA